MGMLQCEEAMLTDDVEGAYRLAAGKWIGCDWPTEFGKTSLNLKGIKAQQALLLARATTGQEGADWRDAVDWLNKVEHDAKLAQLLADEAVALVLKNKTVGALFYIRNACILEEKYHNRLVWQPLRQAIESSLGVTTS